MRIKSTSVVAVVCCALAVPAIAVNIVNDTWNDGERHYPASPTFSEFGVDSDLDGDIESAWFAGGSGTFDPVGPGGPLRITQTTSSASLTTYFTAEGSELTLGSAGDSIRVTWQFSVGGQVLDNTSQGLRIALVDSPAASRVTNENSPGASTYSGYGLFINMASNVFTHGEPFELHERTNPGASENLLSSSSAWASLAAAGTEGNVSYQPGVDYTFILELTRNGADGIDILTSMAGTGLDGTGSMQISQTVAAPNGGSYAFDTFAFRGDGYDRSWEAIDTSLFQVEFVPEPGSVVLMLTGLGLLVATRRKR